MIHNALNSLPTSKLEEWRAACWNKLICTAECDADAFSFGGTYWMPLGNKAQSRLDFTKYLTYLLQAGAPHAQRRGPCCFSRPPVQVSAYLDALLWQRTSSPAVQVRRQECWASECNCKPSRSCFFCCCLGSFSYQSLWAPQPKKPPLKIEKIKKNKKNKIQQLLVPGLRDARLEVELWFRDVSPSLPPLPAAPSRHSASQTLAGSADRAAPRPSATLLAIFRDWRCWKTKTVPAERIPIGRCAPRGKKNKTKRKEKSWGYPGSGLQ